jgi:cytochrome P450
MIDLCDQQTNKQKTNKVLTINGAGHETTANTLSWALQLLALHPVEQRRLQQEIDAIVTGESATFDEAQKLELTLCAVYETLRLYPTVPNYPRQAAVDCKLGGYDIPRGSAVVVAQMSINRDPRWYATRTLTLPFQSHSRKWLTLSEHNPKVRSQKRGLTHQV